MLINRIKDIARDSSIYGLSKVVSKVIGFFLIPLYTSYLTPTDYGILSLIGISSTSLSLIMTFALDSATYRYVGLADSSKEQGAFISNAQFLSFFFLLTIGLLVIGFYEQIIGLLINPRAPVVYVSIGLGISIFSSISSIPRAYLRINRKAKSIALASIVNVLGSVVLTVYFLVGLKMGVKGALLGNMAGNLLSSIVILAKVPLFQLSLVSTRICKQLIFYSLPMLPSQLFAFAMPVYTQFFLKEYMSFRDLGLYSVGLKFTMPMSVVLGMFQQAYSPYKFEILKNEKDPKTIFSKIMTVYIVGVGCMFILLSFYGGFFLKLMTGAEFHEASNLIYYILLIPLSSSYYFMFGTGLEFTKSPVFKPIISGLGFLTVIITLNPLVSSLGIAGAAISTSLGWFVMAICHYIYAQRFYKVKYNWLLVIGITSTVLILGYISSLEFDYKEFYKLGTIIIICLIAYYSVFRNIKSRIARTTK